MPDDDSTRKEIEDWMLGTGAWVILAVVVGLVVIAILGLAGV